MTVTTKTTVLADFEVVSLGVDFPSYFQGFGTAFTDFEFCTYGIGDTEAEALDDCIEMMAQSGNFDFTDEVEQRIRAEYGACDAETTVDDIVGRYEESDRDEDSEDDDCDDDAGYDDGGECGYFHVGIRWNEKADGVVGIAAVDDDTCSDVSGRPTQCEIDDYDEDAE